MRGSIIILQIANARSFLAKLQLLSETGFDAPGLLLLAENLSIIATTPAAERWLAVLAETEGQQEPVLPGGLPYAVIRDRKRISSLTG